MGDAACRNAIDAHHPSRRTLVIARRRSERAALVATVLALSLAACSPGDPPPSAAPGPAQSETSDATNGPTTEPSDDPAQPDTSNSLDKPALWTACLDRLTAEYPELDPAEYGGYADESVSELEDGAVYVSIPWGTLPDGRPESEFNCSFSGVPQNPVIDWVGPTDI
jgi:hypothetical protein